MAVSEKGGLRVAADPKPADEAGFVIDGRTYEIPSFYSLNMDENQIMYEVSGLPTEDWLLMIETAQDDELDPAVVQEVAAKLKNPALLRAIVHIAYRRKHPDAARDDIEIVVGNSNHLANWAALFLAGGDVGDPQQSGSTTRPDRSSPRKPDSTKPMNGRSNAKPGNGSRSGSAKQDETPQVIGTGA